MESNNDYIARNYHHHVYFQNAHNYFVNGYFYELCIDNLKSPNSNRGVKRGNSEYYDVGIYYYPFSLPNNKNNKNNKNKNNNQNNQNNQSERLKFINLGTKKITYIVDNKILFAKKLLGKELSKALHKINSGPINLRGANLEGTNLEKVFLPRANLEGANLEEVNLKDAYLEGADLRGANLRGADLRGADLRGADLRGADIRGALIYQTKFKSLLGSGSIPKDLIYSGDVQLQHFTQ